MLVEIYLWYYWLLVTFSSFGMGYSVSHIIKEHNRCRQCKGTGWVTMIGEREDYSNLQREELCNNCEGSGKRPKRKRRKR